MCVCVCSHHHSHRHITVRFGRMCSKVPNTHFFRISKSCNYKRVPESSNSHILLLLLIFYFSYDYKNESSEEPLFPFKYTHIPIYISISLFIHLLVFIKDASKFHILNTHTDHRSSAYNKTNLLYILT